MLTAMLSKSADFNKLPAPEKAIILSLASAFQDNTQYMFMNPEELELATDIGNKDQWKELLLRQETQSFLKSQMSFLGEIAQRKTFHALVQQALSGNQQAAKQVQELTQKSLDQNKIIIMHRIPRAEQSKEEITNGNSH